jgi:hypothetical protein
MRQCDQQVVHYRFIVQLVEDDWLESQPHSSSPTSVKENQQAAMAVDEVGSEEREERAIAGHASVKGII